MRHGTHLRAVKMKLLVGSKALLYFGEQYLSPKVKRSWDTDWISTYESFEEFKDLNKINKVVPMNRGKTIVAHSKGQRPNEFEIAWDNSTAEELLDIVVREGLAIQDPCAKGVIKEAWIAKPEVIFTLKKSHRFLRDSPHFLKTMHDYHHLRDVLGLAVPDALKDWYKKRTKETYWYKHPNLNVSKDEFFKLEEIPYVYEHDSIHQAMAHFDKPAYEFYKADKAEVRCAKDLFNACSDEVKLCGVLEESYVLALERSQIPSPGVWTPRKSFEVALSKLCSSISSGWFREYAYENYFNVLSLYDDNYVDKFYAGVKSGIVRKLNDKSAS